MTDTLTLIIADDHAVVRQGIRAFLETQPDCQIVAECASAEEASRACEAHQLTVLLLDLIMPGTDVFAAIEQIKRVSPQTQIVILTSYHSDEHIFPALRASALSYVLKDISPDDLIATIRLAVKGEARLHPQIATRVVAEVRQNKPYNPFDELTEREMAVLRLIAQGHSNAEISNELVSSEKTVMGHVSNILSKLGANDRTQLAVLAWQAGLMKK